VSATTFLPATNPYLSISGVGEAVAGLGTVARPKAEFFDSPPRTTEPTGRIGPERRLADPAETPMIRNLAKPSDDEKYFKQLKRF
jgi:hypothetical protein